MPPGISTLARILCWPRSTAMLFVRAMMPPLAAAYEATLRWVARPCTDAVFTIEPPPRFIIYGTQCRETKIEALEVYRQRTVPNIFRSIPDRAVCLDSDVVEQDVDPAEVRSAASSANLWSVVILGRHPPRQTSALPPWLWIRFTASSAFAAYSHLRSLPPLPRRRRPPRPPGRYPCSPAGYNHNFVRKTHVRSSSRDS